MPVLMPTGYKMIRSLLALTAVLSLAGCAHTQLDASEPPESDRPEVLPLMQTEDPEAALMFSVLAAEIAVRSGEHAEAARYYGAAALLSDDPAIAERATRIALFARDHEQAQRSADRWLRLAPESMEASQVSTVLRINAGDAEQAAEQLDSLMNRVVVQGGDPNATLGGVIGQAQDQAAALETMRLLAERRSDDVGVHRVLAEAALRFGEPGEEVLAVTGPARERFPDSVPLQLLHARAQSEAGQEDAAIETLRATVEAHPESREARLGYARVLTEMEDDAFAREEMDRLVELAPEDTQLLLALALMNLEAEQLGPARDYLERLDALGERENDVAYYLGRLHEMADEPDAALAAYGRVEGGDHADDARLRSARLTLRHDGQEAARDLFAPMQQGVDDDLARRAYLAEANALREIGDYAEARARLNRGLVQFPGDTRLLYLRGLVHEREDDIAAAEADFRTILESDPENVAALNALGYTLADRTERYEEAYDLILRAYEQEPDDAAIIDSYGWVLYRLGRLEEAETQLRRAYSLSDDGEIASNLAVVLWERGARDEAREILEAALEREPDHERLQRVRNDLIE
ncbi:MULTISPECIES: tetratricopeptide repeat protein [unclassified Thioalkalivibrio]|uniref:tetratricopeptide repeat protein n=1 Tax=unclassified Thioalkalivibrio TaxID=2621013 RepID=UPI000367150A|nr:MULTISPECIES: tetratricopeptide repeat protein [unclassified Thioalkalivibrio]